MSVLNWIGNLGEKSSRTDVWVVLIILLFFGCTTGYFKCDQNWYLDIIVIGMFTDLGINTIATKFGKK